MRVALQAQKLNLKIEDDVLVIINEESSDASHGNDNGLQKLTRIEDVDYVDP